MDCKIASKHENPEIWFQKLEHIRSRMGSIDPIYTKNDLEIKSFILTKLPKDYSEVVTNEMKTLTTSSLLDVQKEILKFYRGKFKYLKNNDKEALYANADKKKQK